MERIRERISCLLAPSDSLGIFRKLILDDGGGGSASVQGLLRMLGFVHLLSAAGIHLYALAFGVHALLLRGVESLALPVRRGKSLAFVAAAAVWASAWALAGFRPGMVRPLILVGLRTLGQALGFRWRAFTPLMLALALDGAWAFLRWVAWNEVWAPGRVHYALAVGGGMLMLQRVQGEGGKPSVLRTHLAMAIGSWIFTALWDLYLQFPISLVTPILSLLTLPLLTSVIYPSVFLWSLLTGLHAPESLGWIQHSIPILLSGATYAIVFVSQTLLKLPALWCVPIWAGLAGGVLACAMVRSRGLRSQLSVALVVILGIGLVELAPVSASSHEANSVEQLDVGQGDAALIRGRGWAGLYDSGSERALGPAEWLHLLGERQVHRLDFVALSHLDEDHSGGVLLLARLLRVGCVAVSDEELKTERGLKLQRELQKLGVPVLSYESRSCFPFRSMTLSADARQRVAGNAHMTAIWVPVHGGWVYLAAGDADREMENRLTDWFENELRASESGRGGPLRRVLKISHHGSRFSTSPRLLERLRPERVWISAGVGNRFGHPTAETLGVLHTSGLTPERTDRSGVLRLAPR